jgi:elongation factor Ts
MVKSEEVQKLREITGAGVMECKKALEETFGDFERAKILIGERGLAKAEKKADRQTGAGLLESYIHNGRVGVLLELRCETDFVAHTEPVKQLAHELAMHIAAMDPQNAEELLNQPYFRDPAQTVEQVIKQVIARVGENLKVARFMRYQI